MSTIPRVVMSCSPNRRALPLGYSTLRSGRISIPCDSVLHQPSPAQPSPPRVEQVFDGWDVWMYGCLN